MIVLSHRVEVGRWSEGRPVFKKDVEVQNILATFGFAALTIGSRRESRFLLVGEGYSAWTIRRESVTSPSGAIISGRATNSPSSPEAGPSVSMELTSWRYADGKGGWKEGDISVTCEEGGEVEE